MGVHRADHLRRPMLYPSELQARAMIIEGYTTGKASISQNAPQNAPQWPGGTFARAYATGRCPALRDPPRSVQGAGYSLGTAAPDATGLVVVIEPQPPGRVVGVLAIADLASSLRTEYDRYMVFTADHCIRDGESSSAICGDMVLPQQTVPSGGPGLPALRLAPDKHRPVNGSSEHGSPQTRPSSAGRPPADRCR